MTTPTLLAVDDDARLAAAIAAAATELGYVAEWTSSAIRFMQRFLEFRPDIAVIDVLMPDMDGIELARWVGSRRPRTRIVILGGDQPAWAMAAEAVAQHAGATNVATVRKPIAADALRAAIAPRPSPPAIPWARGA